MCILTASGDLTTGGYGTSARFGGGWGWSLPHAFLTDTLFSTEILCDCPLPACFKPTAILKVQLPDSRPYSICKAFKHSHPKVCAV